MHYNAPQAVGHILQELTGGRPYVFTLMSYKKGYHLYERVARLVDEFGLACLRADEVPLSGHDLLAKIHLLIERAEVVIAEISEPSPNVFYEVGFAVAKQKPLLLLAEAGTEIPTDLKGLELIEHGGSQQAMRLFDDDFRRHLRARIGSRLALLRDMLEAPVPRPAFIIASPKYPGQESRIHGQVFDRRTFGDNLGVTGLLAAFGAMLGEDSGVELLSAQYCAPNIFEEPFNLYLIGSTKVNRVTRAFLDALQRGTEVPWEFGSLDGSPEADDWPVGLFRVAGGKRALVEGRMEELHGHAVHVVDHGLVIRAPHPRQPTRIVLLAAGAHSLGSGAACLAVTRAPLIQALRDALPNPSDLADKSKAFWVLVRGEADPDGMLSEQGVAVVEAGSL